VYNAIVWQDRRTAEICDQLRRQGVEDRVRESTGLLLDPYFSATKIHWILQHVEGALDAARQGRLAFGTVDTFLMWRLTGGRIHVTDVSNASRTMLFDIRTGEWDEELLRVLDIPPSLLPEVRPSSAIFAVTDESHFDGPISIAGVAGDQQAATFGQACFGAGSVKNTYGTGNFVLMNTGDQPRRSNHGLVTTIAWQIGDAVTYALEGSVFVTGAAVQWLRDELKLISRTEESEELARSVTSSGGVYLVPAFAGLGAPDWDPYARGTIVGLTRGSGRAHIVRAVIEAAAYQTCDLLDAMRRDTDLEIPVLRVDGGMARNDFLMQFQADMANARIERPLVTETTAQGAAFLAGLATGFWGDEQELSALRRIDRVFEPTMEADERTSLYRGWRRAVERSRDWERTRD
jgi:glycerol kinase